ncbi:unnamed protein product [Brassica oleracea var. botrytis]|uniref:Uncharacterized protein n=2 Tax=Brassica TaxID=3705 RepID=A0A0D3D959_BRAOL|nr:PREDICTED: uncharacterized protein LOC106305391 [Brassica oleracea var. oleracea]XP_013715361.1 uncharacterized protein BNAC07G18300D [Brassica napus]CAF1991010.1 unnamed protein product [Brassica napus]CDY55274.1 BnaC07g18300D [Brassica napus]
MNHLSHHHLRHRSSRPSSSQASIVSGVVHLRCTASEALYNPDVSNVDLEPYSHWSLNFRRNSRLQRMQKRRTTKKKKEAKLRLQLRIRRKTRIKARRSPSRLIRLQSLS